MESWIRDLVTFLVAPIRKLIDETAKRLSAIYQAFVNTLARIRTSFGYWVTRGRAWVTAQARHAMATLNALRWLVAVEIPRRLGVLATSVQAWTRERVADALALARQAVGDVQRWASARLSEALTALSQVRDLITRKFAEVWADLLRIRDKVSALLVDPRRLALWLGSAMLGVLVDLVLDDVDKWAEMFWQRRRKGEAFILSVAERILDRIM